MTGTALRRPRAASDPGAEEVVDARVAKHGGTRRNPKSNYDFPGMAADSDWRQTDVHKATRWFGCVLCGTKFSGPHAVYRHLAVVHDR